MPEISEKELNKLNAKVYEAEMAFFNAEAKQKGLEMDVDEANRLKKTYLIGFLVCIALVLIGVIFGFKNLFSDHETDIGSNEIVVNKSTFKRYKDSVVLLKRYISEEDSINPLHLNEFYAVQLGAFKKVNTQLSSDKYSVVRNAKYNDFNLYTLGVFETEEEAEELLKVVNEIEFKDAFVGKYVNGQRVKIQNSK
jgi:hypothetical protein